MKTTNPTSATAIDGGAAASLTRMQTSGNPIEEHSASLQASLYFHIPFCTKKCDYCHFFVLPNQPENHDILLRALELEWKLRSPALADYQIASIYFGGGTPSLLHPDAIAKILSWPKLPQDIEITLEANPDNLSLDRLKDFRSIGINRISLGVQTLDNGLLKAIGRRHTAEEAIHAIEICQQAGFDNLSIDLMYDLPGQTLEIWEDTLNKVMRLPITHLSLYNLTIEPETLFYKKKEQLQKIIPDPETSLLMFQTAHEKLERADLMPYEISAFAKNNRYSRHNLGYWTGRPFLGFGPSAFSYWKSSRFRNIAHLGKYLKTLEQGLDPVDFSETLEDDARKRELLTIQIRLREGLDIGTFQKKHGLISNETQQSIKALEEKGWILRKGEILFLTSQGILFYDSVAAELI